MSAHHKSNSLCLDTNVLIWIFYPLNRYNDLSTDDKSHYNASKNLLELIANKKYHASIPVVVIGEYIAFFSKNYKDFSDNYEDSKKMLQAQINYLHEFCEIIDFQYSSIPTLLHSMMEIKWYGMDSIIAGHADKNKQILVTYDQKFTRHLTRIHYDLTVMIPEDLS